MLKNYIYLDWNVIQYIKHKTITDGFNAVKFREFMDQLSAIYAFPASEGHLRDLASTYKDGNVRYIEEDLSFLREISNSIMLGVKSDESIVLLKADIFEEFKKIKPDEKHLINVNAIGDNYKIDMGKISKDSLLRPILEKNGGVLDPGVMRNFIIFLYESIDNPEVYKKFRLEVSSIKSSFLKNNTVISKESLYFKKIEVFMDFFEITDIDLLLKRFEKILESFLAIDGRNFDALNKGEKIQVAYALLDFHPLFKDKINKKNKPQNMHRDLNNFFFASYAKYYVTEDHVSYKKSKFVAKALGLRVRVMKMNELRFNLDITSRSM